MKKSDTATTYTTLGSVRGGCGHAHRTLATALRCRRRDDAACGSVGGGAYSDRRVVHAADHSPLTDSERAEMEAIWTDALVAEEAAS